jgi:hypothetical protein
MQDKNKLKFLCHPKRVEYTPRSVIAALKGGFTLGPPVPANVEQS